VDEVIENTGGITEERQRVKHEDREPIEVD
jgi:hypothetical protein